MPCPCPLHISRSDVPIGLRCSRRQIGTKLTDVACASAPQGVQWVHSRWYVGARESYNIVRLPGWYGEGVLFITTLSCVVHVRLPITRRPPDGLPMRPRQPPIPGREPIHIAILAEPDSIGAQSGHNRGTIGASDRLM